MKQHTIYISGKITGIETLAPALFEEAQRKIEKLGHIAVNPMTLNHEHDKSWEAYMREDIKALCDCTAIFLLPNWHDSKGAKAEFWISQQIGLTTFIQIEEIRPHGQG